MGGETLLYLMTRAEQIKSFARDFVNGINRSPERKRLIQDVYYEKFNTRLRSNCSTCYIEAIFKIIKTMDKPVCQYRLKKGAIIQPFGGGIITNDNLTDEIAEKALKDGTANLGMFAIYPETVVEKVIVDVDIEEISQKIEKKTVKKPKK